MFKEENLLYVAARHENLQVILYLNVKRCKLNDLGSFQWMTSVTAVYVAAYHGKFEAMSLLFDIGADEKKRANYSNKKFSVLYAAVRGKSMKCVQYLLEKKKMNINGENGDYPPILGVFSDDVDTPMLTYMLNNGANINVSSSDGETVRRFV